MSIRNFLSRNLTINVGMIIISTLLVLVVILGAYSISSSRSNNNQQAPVQTGISPTSVLPIPSATDTLAATLDPPTPTLEISLSETPITTSSETIQALETDTPQMTQSPTVTGTVGSTTQATQQVIPQPEDHAKLIKNILPVNGGYFAPKDQFKKAWLIQNIGTKTWTKEYSLIFVNGTEMNEKHVFPLSEVVKPGKSIRIEIKQTVPKKPGEYQGSFMLRNKSGVTFGIGPNADQPLTVKVNVLNISPNPAYDFILNYCDATWWNSEGETIQCQGVPNKTSGFVLLDANPILEKNRSDLPALWVHPYNKLEGRISGKYPPYLVKDGDHFKSQVGCIGGNTNCNITFKLLYSTGTGANEFLGTWQELYGGGTTQIDVDLSPLAGEQVQFILRLVATNTHPEDANGFWLIPRIINNN